MKKIYILLLVCTLFILAGCSREPRVLNENGLADIIPSAISGQMVVRNVGIDRRQINDREDIVYAIITMEDNDIQRTAYYRLVINYYDVGGWMVDEWRSYQFATSLPLKPPADNMIYNLMEDTFIGYTIALISTDIDNFGGGETTHIFEVHKEGIHGVVSGEVIITSRFSSSGEQWALFINSGNVSANWNFDNFVGLWHGEWEPQNITLLLPHYFHIIIEDIDYSHVDVEEVSIILASERLHLQSFGGREPFVALLDNNMDSLEFSFNVQMYEYDGFPHRLTRGHIIVITLDNVYLYLARSNSEPLLITELERIVD